MRAEHCRSGLLSAPLCAPSTSLRCVIVPLSMRRRIVRARAQGEEQQGSSSSSNPQRQPPPSRSPSGAADEWWASLNKRSVRGPAPPAVDPEPKTSAEWNERRMGVKGYREFETIKRDERQRVWDAMRSIARQRYERGEMPAWFRPAWLDIDEAPTNTYWRAAGLEHYQRGDAAWDGDAAPQASGGDGGGDDGSGGARNNGGGGSGGGGWWREEDPYWPLRDWGDHPMRWWTLAFAAALAAGGAWACGTTGSGEAARVGLGAGAALALCGGLMSDMRHGWLGAAAVKAAWATCALLALREYYFGWRHKRGRRARAPRLEGTGITAALMCGLYMWTGMGGLATYALPNNPGAAFKMADIATKSKIWDAWGYSNVEMRG